MPHHLLLKNGGGAFSHLFAVDSEPVDGVETHSPGTEQGISGVGGREGGSAARRHTPPLPGPPQDQVGTGVRVAASELA